MDVPASTMINKITGTTITPPSPLPSILRPNALNDTEWAASCFVVFCLNTGHISALAKLMCNPFG